jgi:membrane-associated phospholipid phosphatase
MRRRGSGKTRDTRTSCPKVARRIDLDGTTRRPRSPSGRLDGLLRPRPTVVPQLMVETTGSFPSGHAMMSAVIYLTLGTLVAQLCPRWRERV